MQKSADAFRTISEVAEDLSLPQHVLRFWETRFPQIRPLKRAGGRRYYRPADILLLRTIRQLLYDDGYTIKGVQRLIKEQGAKGLGAASADELNRLPRLDPSDLAFQPDDEKDVLGIDDGLDRMLAGVAASAQADASSCLDSSAASLADALAIVEECQRILEALRRP